MSDDKKFPPFLNTSSKQMGRARRLMENHLQTSTKKARPVAFQGMYSKTYIVTLGTGVEVVVQFRYEPLDIEPFKRARAAMGDLVPTIEMLKDEEVEAADLWPVYMSLIPGVPWVRRSERWGPQLNIKVARSLGKALSLCLVPGSSADVVNDSVVPRLRELLSSNENEIIPFSGCIHSLIDDAHQLDKLPLFISHFDLNDMNIMVLETGEMSGIVDWELSPPPTPFGMGCHRIHDLAGAFHDGKFCERDEYQDMERGFWEEIIAGSPNAFRKTLEDNPEAIQTSFMIGTILHILERDTDGGFHKVSLAALPKFITYRIPALRGDNPPYSI